MYKRQLLPRPSVQYVRDCCRKFKKYTSVTDGFSPRQLSYLSDRGVDCFITIMMIAELFGGFQGVVCTLLIRLILKPTGDRRPIGLFRGFVRCWAKVRQCWASKWQQEHAPDHEFSMTSGRSVGDCVYRSLLRFLANCSEYVAEALWDVAKCFEHVWPTILAQQAHRCMYPTPLLRVSLAMYMWVRRLAWDNGMISRPIWPKKGVVPGSTFALYELIMYFLCLLYTSPSPRD